MAHQVLHPQRTDQAFETAQARKLLENIVESGIAGICRARALFPEAFFKTFRTAGGVISRFDMDTLLSKDGHIPFAQNNHGMQSDTDTRFIYNKHGTVWERTDWNRWRAEAIILLEWIRCGALQVMREGKLARLTFGIHLSAQRQNHSSSNNTLVESYTFDLISCDTNHHRMKRPIDKAALEDSFENLVRNLDSYFATVDNTEYGLLMTQRRFFTVSLDFSEQISSESLPSSIHPTSSKLNTLAIEQAKILCASRESDDKYTNTTVGLLVEPFATGLGIRIIAKAKSTGSDCDQYQDTTEHVQNNKNSNESDNLSIMSTMKNKSSEANDVMDVYSNNVMDTCAIEDMSRSMEVAVDDIQGKDLYALDTCASNLIPQSTDKADKGNEVKEELVSYSHSHPGDICDLEQQRDENSELHSNYEEDIRNDALSVPQLNCKFFLDNQNPGPLPLRLQEENPHPIESYVDLPPTSHVLIQRDSSIYPTGSHVYAIPFGEKKHLPCTILDIRHQHGCLNYKVSFTDHDLILARRKKQWLPKTSISAEIITNEADDQYANMKKHDVRYSYILRPIVVLKRRKM